MTCIKTFTKHLTQVLLLVITIAVISSCGSSSPSASANLWTWVSGSDVIAQSGSYGTQGVADAASMPGARERSISWADTSGNLWLFGGNGFDSVGTPGNLNDLWRYQP